MSSVATAQTTWDLLSCDEVDDDGNCRWLDADGNPHRETAPAFISPRGTKIWFKHGALHREDGPAVIFPGIAAQYWIDNCRLSEEEFNARKLIVNG